MTATILDWARHGENVANLSRTLSHRVFDGDLTELGRAQAHELGARLAASEIEYGIIATSPLRRAVQTADIVVQHLGKRRPDLVVEDLREINPGDIDGRADEQAWTLHDEVLESWRDGDTAVRFPGGESADELTERVRRGLQLVAGRAGERAALVIAHGGNVRFALPGLAGLPVPDEPLDNCAVARLRVSQDSVELVGWPYLADELVDEQPHQFGDPS